MYCIQVYSQSIVSCKIKMCIKVHKKAVCQDKWKLGMKIASILWIWWQYIFYTFGAWKKKRFQNIKTTGSFRGKSCRIKHTKKHFFKKNHALLVDKPICDQSKYTADINTKSTGVTSLYNYLTHQLSYQLPEADKPNRC